MLAYVVGVSFFLVVWAALFVAIPRSRYAMLGASLGFAHLGPILQHWYVRDYWQPEYVWTIRLGGVLLSFEDYLFAFAFAGIAAGVYDWFLRRRAHAAPAVQVGAMIVQLQVVSIGLLLSMVVLVSVAGLNSVHATLLSCALGITLFFGGRRDLIASAVTAASVVALLFWLFYELFFLRLYPLILVDWWDHSALSGLLIGDVPVEEIAWAWAVALFVGPAAAICAVPWAPSQRSWRVRFGRASGRVVDAP